MRTYQSGPRLALAGCGWLLIFPGLAPAQDAVAQKPTELVVSPSVAPSPAFRYRLLPISSELTPGDAAPVYLRLRHELNDHSWNQHGLSDQSWDQIEEKWKAWNNTPLDKLPVDEVRKFVDPWKARLQLLGYGSRREYCDWSYTLPEQGLERIDILLPDCQSMRQWAKLLALKARVETAGRSFDEAIETLETGIAFGRHVGDGPFLINALVGMAICHNMLERLQETIAQPGAPNLYWALTALPRPLVSIRKQVEIEQRVGEAMVPELTSAEQAHSRAEWSVLVENLYTRMRGLTRKLLDENANPPELKARLDIDLLAFKKEALAGSRDFLVNRMHMDPAQLRSMGDDELIARGLVGQYREMRDDFFTSGCLPWREAGPRFAAAEARLRAIKSGPLVVFAQLQPSYQRCRDDEIELDRRVAALRCVEAIRLHAASHGGKLPEALGQITEVPVPDDPATGKPFEYALDGSAAMLSAPVAPLRKPPAFRLTVRRP